MTHTDDVLAEVLDALETYGRPATRKELALLVCCLDCTECASLGIAIGRHRGFIVARGYGQGREYQLTREGRNQHARHHHHRLPNAPTSAQAGGR